MDDKWTQGNGSEQIFNPMEKKPDNRFNLNLTHPVVIDFYNDHIKSAKVYTQSQKQLINFLHKELFEDFVAVKIIMEEVREMHIKLEEALHDFFMSYHAFKLEAEINEEVRTEFEKLPPSFDDVEEYFHKLLAAYEKAENDFFPLLESLGLAD